MNALFSMATDSSLIDISINLKTLGKRKVLSQDRKIAIPARIDRPEALIEWLVRLGVRNFNAGTNAVEVAGWLSGQRIEELGRYGKVSFGERYNAAAQDEEQAVRNALQSFTDGLYRILVNRDEVTSGDRFQLKENDVLTFIRLTMLSGRSW